MNNVCKAPCVINATGKYSIVFCQLEYGHGGVHIHQMKDSIEGIQSSVAWQYTGKIGTGGISPARGLHERCEGWINPEGGLPRFRDLDSYRNDSVIRMEVITDQTGFCCGKEPGHKGWHERSGTFGPLGVDWKILWSSFSS